MTNGRLKDNPTTRRNFLKKVAGATAAGLTVSSILPSGCSNTMAMSSGRKSYRLTERNNVILFQGDSITDAGRSKRRQDNANDIRAMGIGYVLLAASEVLAGYCEVKPKIYNRGISGNKVFQLADRWDADCIALKPDIISILIGVNDYWHASKHGYEGTVETYERDYRALLGRTRRELPKVKLVICEPFVLKCGEVDETWFPDFDGYRAVAKKMAAEFDTIFIPFQSMFDEAIRNAPPDYWAADGVHPSLAGSCFMAKAWLKAVLGISA
ncbi:MAG: SGNH/GDSL hydrolase family protein [Phycisphaerales bacterium]|jgi:lysophospholipase L1-like esterase